jgi:polyribonucleotide nucleotidyltransferase
MARVKNDNIALINVNASVIALIINLLTFIKLYASLKVIVYNGAAVLNESY